MRYLIGRGNVRCGMHLIMQISVGHLSGRGNVRRGCVWLGKCPSGMCLVGEMSVGVVSGRGSVRRGRVPRGNVCRGSVRESYILSGFPGEVSVNLDLNLLIQSIFVNRGAENICHNTFTTRT